MNQPTLDKTIIAFIHVEKAAGTTMSRILRRNYGIQHVDVEPLQRSAPYFSAQDLRWTRRLIPGLASIAGHSVKPFGDLHKAADIFYYTFLREPIDRCASHYQFQIQVMKKTIPFEMWIADKRYWNFQSQKLAGIPNAQQALDCVIKKEIFIGFTDAFDEALLLLRNIVHIKTGKNLDLSYARENVAGDNLIKSELLRNSHTRTLLEQANQEDMQLYEVVRKTIYEKQRQDYGTTLVEDISNYQKTKSLSRFNTRYFLGLLMRNTIYKPSMTICRRLKWI